MRYSVQRKPSSALLYGEIHLEKNLFKGSLTKDIIFTGLLYVDAVNWSSIRKGSFNKFSVQKIHLDLYVSFITGLLYRDDIFVMFQ